MSNEIENLKQIRDVELLNIGLYAIELDTEKSKQIIEICYNELIKRRKIEKNNIKQMIYNKTSMKELLRTAREYYDSNPYIATMCYNEILWRRRLDELKCSINTTSSLEKLENLIKQEKDNKDGIKPERRRVLYRKNKGSNISSKKSVGKCTGNERNLNKRMILNE
jgi:hypothetical protein